MDGGNLDPKTVKRRSARVSKTSSPRVSKPKGKPTVYEPPEQNQNGDTDQSNSAGGAAPNAGGAAPNAGGAAPNAGGAAPNAGGAAPNAGGAAPNAGGAAPNAGGAAPNAGGPAPNVDPVNPVDDLSLLRRPTNWQEWQVGRKKIKARRLEIDTAHAEIMAQVQRLEDERFQSAASLFKQLTDRNEKLANARQSVKDDLKLRRGAADARLHAATAHIRFWNFLWNIPTLIGAHITHRKEVSKIFFDSNWISVSLATHRKKQGYKAAYAVAAADFVNNDRGAKEQIQTLTRGANTTRNIHMKPVREAQKDYTVLIGAKLLSGHFSSVLWPAIRNDTRTWIGRRGPELNPI